MFKKFLCTTALIVALGATPAIAGHHEGEDGKKMDHKEMKHDGDHKKMEDKKNLVTIAAENEDFSTLVAAVKAAGLADALTNAENITIFAPTNAAFAKLPAGAVADLLKPENKEKLQSVLKYHVADQKIKGKYLLNGTTEVNTLQGTTIMIEKSENGVTVDGANVTAADIKGSNGIIHVIDTVIMPE